MLAGPLCTQMLADHGADVIKVEPPAGDETRASRPAVRRGGRGGLFRRGQPRQARASRSTCRAPDGRAVLEVAAEDADVLVENFLPGTMERWGLGYETLVARAIRA